MLQGSAELFSTTGPEGGELALSEEGVAMLTTADLATPANLSDTMELEDKEESMELWSGPQVRKRPSSGESSMPKLKKAVNPLTLSNRFEFLAGTLDRDSDMDMEVEFSI